MTAPLDINQSPPHHNLPTRRLRARDIEMLMTMPAHAVATNADQFKPGSVLDVGCGVGRNALRLATEGFDVTGVDTDPEAIASLEAIARNYDQTSLIHPKKGDIVTIPLGSYDNVIAIFSLRFLPHQTFYRAIERLQTVVRPGGLTVIQELTQNGPIFGSPQIQDQYWPETDELRQLYAAAGWKIVSYGTQTVPTTYADDLGYAIDNETATLVARKPETEPQLY